MTAMLESVLGTAARGFRLFPCVQRGKTPLLKDWPHRASCDADVVSKWAQRHPGCNWAIATGSASGLFVIDIDDEVGNNSFCSLVEQHGTWVKTLSVTTARGQHFYFTYPATGAIRNSTGKLGKGIDVRGDGGFVLCPPSIHPDGPIYAWTNPPSALVGAPPWVLDKITTKTELAIVQAASEIGSLPEGCRNDGLARFGGFLRRRGFSQVQIEAILIDKNARRCRPPLPTDEVRKIAASVARYAPGGPDPLESAWQAIPDRDSQSQYQRFLALARQLQQARPEQSVALPLERIAALMAVDWTTVRYYRRRATTEGFLQRTAPPIAHRRAAEYRVTIPITPINGLVGKNAMVGKDQEDSKNSMVGNSQKPHGGKPHGGNGSMSMVGKENAHGGEELGTYVGYFSDEVQ
jgi:hypothetical protein